MSKVRSPLNSIALNQPLAWASDNKQLFALSRDANIPPSSGTTLSKWAIHNSCQATLASPRSQRTPTPLFSSLSSEEPSAILSSPFSASSFSVPFQNYIPQQQEQFYQLVLPPGLDILENLKLIIKDGQHEFYRTVSQPAALASLYMGHIPQGVPHPGQLPQDYPSPLDDVDTTTNNVPSRSLAPLLALTLASDGRAPHPSLC